MSDRNLEDAVSWDTIRGAAGLYENEDASPADVVRALSEIAVRDFLRMTEKAIAPLDAAWKEAEAALPWDWRIEVLEWDEYRHEPEWWAGAKGPMRTTTCNLGHEHNEEARADGYGSTPQAALQALTRALLTQADKPAAVTEPKP